MSEKSLDQHKRWRSVTVGFRMSPEESEMLNRKVALSGMSKQDYITHRLLGWEVTVRPNSRIYKALSNEMERIHAELLRITEGNEVDPELRETIHMVAELMNGMKGGDHNAKQKNL